MKTKAIFLLLSVFIYLSCSTDDPANPTRSFEGSLFVTVKEPGGLPVKGAQITIGDLMGTTGGDGTYFFTQVTLTGDDYLQVDKAGYFKGSRRFCAKDASTQFLRITLLPRVEIGSFNSAQPATLSIDNTSKLTFPAHAVSRKDGSPYQGQVHVMASPLYGDDPQLTDKMPGALVALDESGNRVALGSLGMLAVELQADNGEVLDIASGKTVEVQFAVADPQLAYAPSSIPLWYFDEDQGFWVQEGEAELSGNIYVAPLPHFSWWNWDVTLELINWEASFQYPDERPAQNVQVCVTIKSLNDQRCAYTNLNGVVYGPLPANEALIVSIRNECGALIFAEDVGPFSDDISMSTRMLEPSEPDYATISGTAVQCDGSPLTSGFVKVSTPANHFIFPISDAEGHFEGGYVYCEGDVVTLYVYDITNSLVSLPQVITFERHLSPGSIKACDQPDEFIRYSVTGFSPEYVYYFPEVANNNFAITRIFTLDSIGVKGHFGFTFDGVTPGPYTGYPSLGNQINLPNGQKAYITTMNVNVTEYGTVHAYIRGDFSGKINAGGNGAGGTGASDFSGSFSVRNE